MQKQLDINKENMYLNIIFDKNQEILQLREQLEKIELEKNTKPVKEG